MCSRMSRKPKFYKCIMAFLQSIPAKHKMREICERCVDTSVYASAHLYPEQANKGLKEFRSSIDTHPKTTIKYMIELFNQGSLI